MRKWTLKKLPRKRGGLTLVSRRDLKKWMFGQKAKMKQTMQQVRNKSSRKSRRFDDKKGQ